MLVNKTEKDIYVRETKIASKANDIIALASTETKMRVSVMYYKDSTVIDLD